MEKERIRVKLCGYDIKLVDQSVQAIINAVDQYNTAVVGPIPLPTTINKYTVLKSPFVHKKSREQFEMRTHKRLLDIMEPSAQAMDALMKLELSAGVQVDIKQ